MAEATESESLMRILIATDNHLGVWENDQIRRDDCYETMDEIFQLAGSLDADCVLLGGDLFHDSKPSLRTMNRTMQIFAKHCLNDRPVRFQVCNKKSDVFESGSVNYSSPNLNVGLPIFTIHGNHDDPSGLDYMSSVDILASAGLVNYFGKKLIDDQGRAEITPILLKKGETKIALYGLGHIRDERMGRMFVEGKITWVRPAAAPGCPTEDWFNIFVLHQNRVSHGNFARNSVKEKFLANFLDFVVWGHEHECIPTPQDSAVGKFKILQPGSSVATALSEGESRAKHVVMLEILGNKFRTIKYPLQTVRPFVYDQLTLSNEVDIEIEGDKSTEAFLEKKVSDLAKQIVRQRPAPPGHDPKLPLVRIRVDYTGFSTINTLKFGQNFVGKVANPQDIILWAKATPKRTEQSTGKSGPSPNELKGGQMDFNKATLDELIAAHLPKGLEVLSVEKLNEAVHKFVDKDDKGAIAACYDAAIKEGRQKFRKDQSDNISDDGFGLTPPEAPKISQKDPVSHPETSEVAEALQDDTMDLDFDADVPASVLEPSQIPKRTSGSKRRGANMGERSSGKRGQPGTLAQFLTVRRRATQPGSKPTRGGAGPSPRKPRRRPQK